MKRISIIILLFLISPYIYAQSKDEIICLESEIHSDGNIFNLKIKENYLFINDINVIKIYDLNLVKIPILLDTLAINCSDFEIVSDYAFCLNISNRVQIFDISNCKNFNLISEIDFPTQGIPISIKVIGNTILILEESKSFGAGYEYYYYITIINIDKIENPRVVDRKPLNYEPAWDYFCKIFISLSDYIYFYHSNLGKIVFKVDNGELYKANDFPFCWDGKFYNNVFYLRENENIYMYILNEHNQFVKTDSLVNEDEHRTFLDFDILGNNIIEGFGNPFELRVYQYLENRNRFEEIGSFQNFDKDAQILNISVNDKILIVSLAFERILIFSHQLSNNTNIYERKERQYCYNLLQNYPNPFNQQTTIHFGVPKSSAISIIVYNVRGEMIEYLFKGKKEAGNHFISWDAKGRPSGIYLIRLQTDNFRQMRKCLLLK